jgi:hypothetical protein
LRTFATFVTEYDLLDELHLAAFVEAKLKVAGLNDVFIILSYLPLLTAFLVPE